MEPLSQLERQSLSYVESILSLFDRYLICRDTVNIYVGALVYHRKHFVDLPVRPLHLQQYGSVRLISYPASHTKHVCGVFRPVTETDALNCTIDKYLFSDYFFIIRLTC